MKQSAEDLIRHGLESLGHDLDKMLETARQNKALDHNLLTISLNAEGKPIITLVDASNTALAFIGWHSKIGNTNLLIDNQVGVLWGLPDVLLGQANESV